MSRKTRTPITVENQADDLDARWLELGRQLRIYEPEEHRRILALVSGFVSLHAPTREDETAFKARLAEICKPTQEAN